jgi:hypothetical protein
MKKRTAAPKAETPARPWHALAAETAAAELKSDPAHGISPADAAERLGRLGPNELVEKPRPGFLALLLEQLRIFWSSSSSLPP